MKLEEFGYAITDASTLLAPFVLFRRALGLFRLVAPAVTVRVNELSVNGCS